MNTIIEPESPRDEDQIHRLTCAAFKQNDEADLITRLRKGGHIAFSLVARRGVGELAGHILLSRLVTPEGFLALAPISVDPARQGQGIASALIKHAIEEAKNAGWLGIFVLGDPNFYARFGFTIEGAAKFQTPYPKDYFMALDLAPGALDDVSGEVNYPQPFSDLG